MNISQRWLNTKRRNHTHGCCPGGSSIETHSPAPPPWPELRLRCCTQETEGGATGRGGPAPPDTGQSYAIPLEGRDQPIREQASLSRCTTYHWNRKPSCKVFTVSSYEGHPLFWFHTYFLYGERKRWHQDEGCIPALWLSTGLIPMSADIES